MALFNMTDLAAALRRGERLIGLDPGSKTIGVALSDVGRTLASPYGTIPRGKLRANAAEVLALCARGEADIIFPTRRNLERLALFDSFDAALDNALSHPVLPITPFAKGKRIR